MIKMFEGLLPQRWRKRPAPKPEMNDAVLARLQDEDPVYRAVMDHAYEMLEQTGHAAVQPKISASDRDFLAGEAYGLARFVLQVENVRARARELREQELRAQQEREKLAK